VKAAQSAGVPVLAVCRGIQVLNVALGGTLHQHITTPDSRVDHGFGKDSEWTTHPVEIIQGSALFEVIGGPKAECSTHHHQAIDELGDGLQISARAVDGIIEAVETSDAKVIGVQWHPEMTAAEDPMQQSLFDWLVRTAGGDD
jgi:putative glutamine amidotransferase